MRRFYTICKVGWGWNFFAGDEVTRWIFYNFDFWTGSVSWIHQGIWQYCVISINVNYPPSYWYTIIKQYHKTGLMHSNIKSRKALLLLIKTNFCIFEGSVKKSSFVIIWLFYRGTKTRGDVPDKQKLVWWN